MSLQLQYITDPAGNKTAVVISYDEWTAFERKYQKLLKKLDVLDTIREGIQEVKEARRKGVPLQSLEDFLHES
jgi:hypothetical protein